MFRRHAREPFPIRNIIAFAVIVLIVLFFVAQQMKKAEEPVLIDQLPANEQSQ